MILYTVFLNKQLEPELLVINEKRLNKELNLKNAKIKLSY